MVIRFTILDRRLLDRKATPLEELVGTVRGSSDRGALVSALEPGTEEVAAKSVLMLDAQTRAPFGKCSISCLGGSGGGAGEAGRVEALSGGGGGRCEGDLMAALALEARRRCNSAKAAEAKGNLSGLLARV